MSRRIIKNNPAFLSDQELLDSFVVRHSELNLILEIIRENRAKSNQHVLIVGSRGMGKTMLVLRIASAVRNDGILSKAWHPIFLGEESYDISTPGEFWLRTLFHLGEQTGEERWKRSYHQLLQEGDEKRLHDSALSSLMDFTDEQGKRILLIAENVNMLFGEQMNSDDIWTLRHTLQNEPRVMLLATATARFNEIENSGKALFELFKIYQLNPLNTKESRIFWEYYTGQAISDHRIKPIRIWTGGNPRLLGIISSFEVKPSLKELMTDLTFLLDEHTNYFKSNIDNLPNLERKVFITLADIWKPASARDVAKLARIDVNKTSSFLNRLASRGMVEIAKQKGNKKLYQVSERLYNIYYLMRKSDRNRDRVKAVANFMIQYYEDEELYQKTVFIAKEACEISPEIRKDHFSVYEIILESIEKDEARGKLIQTTSHDFFALPDISEHIRESVNHVKESTSTEQETIDKKWPEKREYYCDEKEIRYQLTKNPNESILWVNLGNVLRQSEKYNEAEDAYNKAKELDPKCWAAHYFLVELIRFKSNKQDSKKVNKTTFEMAEHVLRWVIKANPNNFSDHFYLKMLLTCNIVPKRHDEIRAAADQQLEAYHRDLITKYPHDPLNQFILFPILTLQGKWKDIFTLLPDCLNDEEFVKKYRIDFIWFFSLIAASGFIREGLDLLINSKSLTILEPLVVALHMSVGEEYEAPQEVVEVAKDIQSLIQEIIGLRGIEKSERKNRK